MVQVDPQVVQQWQEPNGGIQMLNQHYCSWLPAEINTKDYEDQ